MGDRLNRKWPRKPWHHLPDEALCSIPVGRLDLKWNETPLVAFEHQLQHELTAAGIVRFQPHVYLGDEWFSPVGVAAIAVPFYLADPRLKKLARRFYPELEGGSPASFMRLLRHEAGHAFEHAYKLSELPGWIRVFGDVQKPYRSRSFRFNPHSTDFVRHLDRTYAQAHPSEDFAETFATVLTPGSRWRERYAKCPGALTKLSFVADLLTRHGSRAPSVTESTLTYQAQRMRRTVGEFFTSQEEIIRAQDRERRLRLVFPMRGSGSAHDFLKKQKTFLLSALHPLPPGARERLTLEYDQLVKCARRLALAAPRDSVSAHLRLAGFLGDSLSH